MGTNRVVPNNHHHNEEPALQSKMSSKPNQQQQETESFDIKKRDDLDSVDGSISEPLVAKKRNPILGCLLSIRLFLILVITGLILLTVFSIWITAFEMNQVASIDNSKTTMKIMYEKVSNFLMSQLLPAKSMADTVAQDYHMFTITPGFLAMKNYLFTKMINFPITGANLCFGENNMSVIHAYNLNQFPTEQLFFAWQDTAANRFCMYSVNHTDANIMTIARNITYVVAKTDWYMASVEMLKTNPNGGYGPVYKVLNGGLAMYWSSPVYDRELLKANIKQRVGIVKINLNLLKISQYLLSTKLLNTGFLVVTELGPDAYVMGASFSIKNLDSERIPVRNVQERGIGSLMKAFLDMKVEEGNVVTVDKYLVSSYQFSYANIVWQITMFVEETEVKASAILSSYVILGVTLFFAIFGVVLSIVIGTVVTKPFKNLESDFQKIEIMDLMSIEQHRSLFTEVSNIYGSLTETVGQLKEFRAFLPESVLNQFEYLKNDNNNLANKDSSKNAGNPNELSNGFSFREGDAKPSFTTMSENGHNGSGHSKFSEHRGKANSSMFKLGLSYKDLCIVYVKIPGLDDRHYSNYHELSHVVCRLISGVSSICKSMKADLEIKSHDEFMIKIDRFSSSCADIALKISTALTSNNETFKRDGQPSIKVHIGVASGNMLSGNVGNKTLRYSAHIGSVIDRAIHLCNLNAFIGTSVLIDEETHYLCGAQFVDRPVDRYANPKNGEKNVENVYELLRNSSVENDEWMYELQQKKENENCLFCRDEKPQSKRPGTAKVGKIYKNSYGRL
ncbi:predicted protein [Naegleria gruberi]|uniref:Predicted protein n=1 Tax=Naegleria gruberi TaxID=5762 RepID=D2W1N7_NAEGR|nr:uncharacterized protein NAEGRDRAFT_75320 [Naegleria gruberi]EFC36954.1 predicted protein [Naegleria gruberi]|eukprot:XP_002669698.1 predicted protein [Naegleria gruberi strain NEG-M]